jgi:hypothetical protein
MKMLQLNRSEGLQLTMSDVDDESEKDKGQLSEFTPQQIEKWRNDPIDDYSDDQFAEIPWAILESWNRPADDHIDDIVEISEARLKRKEQIERKRD